MSRLRDYYEKEQKKKDKLNAEFGTEVLNKQTKIASDLHRLMLGVIQDILTLAESVKPEALPISWKINRKLSSMQRFLMIRPYKNMNSFAWDVGSNYFLTVEGRMLIRRRVNRDYRKGSYYYEETFPYRESMDDPYNACECLIDFLEKLGGQEELVRSKRNLLNSIKD
ncbi:MAG: hypothetical protein Q8T08_02900 [Ignavibacteria bacterium]|nr:hypothetical protein [Ignavibacteria bacterium]